MTVVIGYSYMFLEEQAIGVYGTVKSYGRDCIFVDAYLSIHEYHIPGKSGEFWIHGCPMFEPTRD
jgi:hypothetical protein